MARHGFPQPSAAALRKAGDLGREMAQQAPALMPIASGARFATHYEAFAAAHRQKLESLPEFAPWEARLQKLIDRYARSSGLRSDEIRQWDLFLSHVAAPLWRAFWEGWETQKGLAKLYEEHVPSTTHAEPRRRVSRPVSPIQNNV